MKAKQNISLCSSIMRAPYVFEQYKRLEGLTRDLTIWLAWNGAREARLNVRQFAKMFGYSDAYLFKKLSTDETEWLREKEFGPEFKGNIGLAIAKLYIERLNFPKAAAFVTADEEGVKREYAGLNIVVEATTETTRRGTNYFLTVNNFFLKNCTGKKDELRYQSFDLNDYLSLASTNGKAWPAGRRGLLHLSWKRGVWNAPGAKQSRHEVAQLDELVRVAGFKYTKSGETRLVHELRQLLEDLSCFPSVQMSADIRHEEETGGYRVKFTKHKELEPLETV